MSAHPRLAWSIAALAGLLIAALVVLALTSALGERDTAALDQMRPTLTAGAQTPAVLSGAAEPQAERTPPPGRPEHTGRDGSNDRPPESSGSTTVPRPDQGEAPRQRPGTGGEEQAPPRRRDLRAAPVDQRERGLGDESEADTPETEATQEATPESEPRRMPDPVAALEPIAIPEPEPTPTGDPGQSPGEPSP